MSRHYPGPWRVVTPIDGVSYPSVRCPLGVIAPTIYGRDAGAVEANARLVAAAPEMLELLEEAERGLIAKGFTGTLTLRIHAALNKARGEPLPSESVDPFEDLQEAESLGRQMLKKPMDNSADEEDQRRWRERDEAADAKRDQERKDEGFQNG